MATSGLYGSSPTGAVISAPGSESAGLYGNGTTFGGSYFEWFIFIQADTQPATPTGGSWSFSTNSGTPPTGWSSTPPAAPTLPVWVSIALVNSKNASTLEWSAPGVFSYSSGLPILSGTGSPTSGDGLNNQLWIQTGTTPETIWFKQSGTWVRLSGSTLYVDTSSNQTVGGTKTFSNVIVGSVSGTSNNVTGIVSITNGGTGQTSANSAFNALAPSQTGNSGKFLTTDGTDTSWSTNPLGTVTSVAVSGGTTGLTTSGGPITTSGTITLAGTLAVANGGTGATTANGALTNLGGIGDITSTDGSVTITPTGTSRDLSVAVAAATNNVIAQVRNTTGATLTKGTVVYISGATGQIPTVSKALATTDATSAQTLGMMTADLANNSNGNVTIIGLITNIDTSAYTDGQQLYLSGTTAGTVTATKPYAPIHLVYVAVVEHAHPTQGKLFVKVQNGYELDELHNVSAQSPTTGQTIVYNSATSLWEKNTVSLTAGVNGTLPIANGGTGQTTANAAFNALAPSQTGNSGKYLTTDGSNTSWATNPLGTVTSVAATVPSFLSISGSPITTSGTLAFGLSGTALPTTSGGTGLTSFTANGVVYASSTSALTTGSALTFDGTNLGMSNGASVSIGGNVSLYGDANQTVIRGRVTNGTIFQGSDGLEKIRLSPEGYFLVGATSSSGTGNNRLQVGSSNATTQLLLKTSTGHSATYVTGVNVYQTWASGAFYALGITPADGSSFTENARISPTGQFLIGTTGGYNGERLVVDSNGGSIAYNSKFVNSSTSSSVYASTTWSVGEATSAVGYIGTGGSAVGNVAFRNNFVIGTQNSTPLVFNTVDAEKMRLDTSGNLGLGTSSPTKRLQFGTTVGGAVASPITFQFADDYSSGYTAAGAKLVLYGVSTAETYGIGTGPASDIQYHAGGAGNTLGRHAWYSGNSEKMRLNASGQLALGTSTAATGALLTLRESATNSGALSMTNRNNTQTWLLAVDATAVDDKILAFIDSTNSAVRMALDSNGNFLVGNTTAAATLTLPNTAGSAGVINKISLYASGSTPYYGFGISANQLNYSADGSHVFYSNSIGTSPTERMRLDASGNLLLGTTSQSGSAKLTVKQSTDNSVGGLAFVATDGNGAVISRTTDGSLTFRNGGFIRFDLDSSGRAGLGTQGTTGDRFFDMSFQGATLDAGANGFALVANPTFPNTITSTIFNIYTGPNLTAGTTVANVYNLYLEANNTSGSTVTGNKWGLYQAGSADKNYFAGNLTVNNGITFPASQVSSSDANTLDDYEEGTWTPNLSGSGGGSYTMGGSNGGRYIKIGKMVYATATLQWTGQTTAYSGNLWVAGLPFTSGGNRSIGSLGAVSGGLAFTSGYGEWNYLIDPGYSSVYIIQNSTTGSGYSHGPTVSTTGLVYALTIVYEANA
jgi:hypothetical protein